MLFTRTLQVKLREEMVTPARCWYRRTGRSGTDDERSWFGPVKVVEVEVEVYMDEGLTKQRHTKP